MEIETIGTLVAVVGSAVSIYLAIRKNKSEIRKLNFEADSGVASATDELARSAELLVEPLNKTIESLRAHISELEADNKRQDDEALARLKQREKEIVKLRRVIRYCTETRTATVTVLKTTIDSLQKALDDMDDDQTVLKELEEFFHDEFNS